MSSTAFPDLSRRALWMRYQDSWTAWRNSCGAFWASSSRSNLPIPNRSCSTSKMSSSGRLFPLNASVHLSNSPRARPVWRKASSRKGNGPSHVASCLLHRIDKSMWRSTSSTTPAVMKNSIPASMAILVICWKRRLPSSNSCSASNGRIIDVSSHIWPCEKIFLTAPWTSGVCRRNSSRV